MTYIKQFILLTFVLFPIIILAQTNQITTIILIRHAEKVMDGSKNPELSTKGKERAIALKNLFQHSGISAIYSTNFTRTIHTVQPLADNLNLSIEKYDPFDNQFTANILLKHEGQTIVISGHSNTTPQLVNQFINEEKYKSLDDSEYSKIYVVNASKQAGTKVIELSY